MRSFPSLSDLAALARSLPNGDREPDAAAREAKATVINSSTVSIGVIEPKIDFLIIHLQKKIFKLLPLWGRTLNNHADLVNNLQQNRRLCQCFL
jgi:hypothetical protein